jgi:hypothetical protein
MSTTSKFQVALLTSLVLRTKTASKTQTAIEENPSQNLAKLLENYQGLTNNTSA